MTEVVRGLSPNEAGSIKPTSSEICARNDVPVTSLTSIWSMVSRWLPSRNADCDYWWQLTGPHLAVMLFEAGYSVHDQYEGMLFHYHTVVPRLGPCASPSQTPKWKSLLTVDGTPIEYSWKWNTVYGVPDVRYTMEPIGSLTGTSIDPLNQDSTKDLLYKLSLAMPSLDLTWFHHFAAAFYDSDKQKYATEPDAHLTTTMSLAFEFLEKGLTVKTYFAPKKLGQKGPVGLDIWENAVRGIAPANASLDKVFSFIKTDVEGSLLQPFMLAIDCVKPSKSRMKLYVQSPHTSFDSVRTIMTMGGQIHGMDHALEELNELIKLTVGLDKDFPSSREIPASTAYAPAALANFKDLPILLSGYLYYFDVAPGSSVPDIKFYIPIRRYGKDDLQIARGLTRWMESRGRGRFNDNYMRILESLATHRTLDSAVGVQTYISCAFQKGELSITTYMGPEAYHPQRLSKLAD
ncbi:MAG: hypothetical protein Q9187_000160 [Circinaria calcarea]